MATEKKMRTQAEVEQARRRKEEQARRAKRRNRQWIGVALSILIVVGAVSIVRSGIELSRTLLDNTPEREEYTLRLTTMVWFDVLPFESTDQIDPNALKQVAIWGVIEQIGTNNLEHDEIGAAIVPVNEVNRYIGELFGPNVLSNLPSHETFTDLAQGITYMYDAERQAYTVPATGLQPLYLPTVVDIQNEGNGIKRVVVGYVSTHNANDSIIATPDFENPTRYRDFFFLRDGNEYYLYAMRPNTTITPTQPASSGAAEEAPSSSLPTEEAPVSLPEGTPPAGSNANSAPESTPGDDSAGSTPPEDENTGVSSEAA